LGKGPGKPAFGELERTGQRPAIFFVIISFLLSSLGAAVLGLIVGLGGGRRSTSRC
jgi:hypothetical protein